jgi:transposase-like protein
LEILVQSRRNTQAAQQCFRQLLKGLTYVPRIIIPNQLKRDGAAQRELLPGGETASESPPSLTGVKGIHLKRDTLWHQPVSAIA